MRIRATVAAVAGALALSAFAVPAAQADGGSGDTTITKVVVDGDNKVSVGPSAAKTIKVSVTAQDDSGIAGADAFTLKGPGYGFFTASKPTCTAVSSTTSTCTASVLVDPKVDYLSNANARTWYVEAWIDADDGDFVGKEAGASTYTTAKTVHSDQYGNLKATVTASTDGCFRYSFAGTTTTSAVNAAGDFVDVR